MDMIELFETSENIQYLDEGDTVFRQGDPPEFMYVILSGEVEIVLGNDVIDRLKEGDVFGEMALVDNFVRSATARVSRRCSLARVDRDAFVMLVRRAPWFALEVLSILADRLRRHMVVTHALLEGVGPRKMSQ